MSKKAKIVTFLIVITIILSAVALFLNRDSLQRVINPIASKEEPSLFSGRPDVINITPPEKPQISQPQDPIPISTQDSRIVDLDTFILLSKSPVAGYKVGDADDVIFIRQGDGAVIKTNLLRAEEEVLSNLAIPQTLDAYFFGESGAIVRTFADKDLNSFEIDYENQSIQQITNTKTVAGNGENVFYISGEGSARGILLSDSGSRNIFSSVIKNWNARFYNNNSIVLTQAPSVLSQSSSFILRPNGVKELLVQNKNSLTTIISAEEDFLFYSSTARTAKLKNVLVNLSTGEERELSFATLADKCAFDNKIYIVCGVPQNLEAVKQIPDNWYSGESSFQDLIYVTSLARGEVVGKVGGGEFEYDVSNPTVYKNYFIFIDKITRSLVAIKFRVQ